MVGGICPICNPNIKVKFADPLHIKRDITTFQINPLYEISDGILCNYYNNIHCVNVNCRCKDKSFLNHKSWEHWTGVRNEFWPDYLTNLGGLIHDSVRIPTHEENMPDATSSDTDDDELRTSQSQPDLVTEQTMRDADVFAFAVRKPPQQRSRMTS